MHQALLDHADVRWKQFVSSQSHHKGWAEFGFQNCSLDDQYDQYDPLLFLSRSHPPAILIREDWHHDGSLMKPQWWNSGHPKGVFSTKYILIHIPHPNTTNVTNVASTMFFKQFQQMRESLELLQQNPEFHGTVLYSFCMKKISTNLSTPTFRGASEWSSTSQQDHHCQVEPLSVRIWYQWYLIQMETGCSPEFLGPFQLGVWKKNGFTKYECALHRSSWFFPQKRTKLHLDASKKSDVFPRSAFLAGFTSQPRCVLWSNPSTGHPSNLCKHAKCRRSQRPQIADGIFLMISCFPKPKITKGAFFCGEIAWSVAKVGKKGVWDNWDYFPVCLILNSVTSWIDDASILPWVCICLILDSWVRMTTSVPSVSAIFGSLINSSHASYHSRPTCVIEPWDVAYVTNMPKKILASQMGGK